MTAPERVWLFADNLRQYLPGGGKIMMGDTEYIRADIHASVIDKADALADAAGRVSEWDAWAYTYGGVCPDHLIGCIDDMRTALAAYCGVTP